MSKRCDLCHRGATSGNRVSHSNVKTKRRFGVNLVSKIIGATRMRVCTRCLRTHSKRLRAA